MKSLLHGHLRGFSLVCALLTSVSAGAQDVATAEALFNSGLADMQAGRYETGCKALAESQRLDPRLGTLFTLATCDERWGHIATADTRFGEYLALYERLPDEKKAAHAERYKVATETRARLGPDVPYLRLSLPAGAPAGTVVKRDGEVVAAAALGLSLPLDPGEHTVSTLAPGGTLWERKITAGRGEKKQLTLEVTAKVTPAPTMAPIPLVPGTGSAETPVAAPDVGPGGRRVVTYVIGGTGIVGVIIGGILGGLTVAKADVIHAHCGTAIGQTDPTACDPTGLDASASANGLGLGSTLALSLGGAALAAAVVLFVTEPTALRPVAGKGSRWVSAGVLSVGPTGTMLGVQGAW